MNDDKWRERDNSWDNSEPAGEPAATPVPPAAAPADPSGGGGSTALPSPALIWEESDPNFEQKAFEIDEQALARACGANRSVIADLRKTRLKKGVEWEVVARIVRLSKTAAVSICNALGVEFPESLKKTRSDESGSQDELLTVHRVGFKNTRVIHAIRPNGEIVTVMVKSASNFRLRLRTGKPMTFKGRQQGLRWVLVGRCPRYPGKW